MFKDTTRYRVQKTALEWRVQLSQQAYEVLRAGVTEWPGTSPLNKEHRPGIFRCEGCVAPLYSSEDKFESGTGWPSFTRPINPRAVLTRLDLALLLPRTEVHCANCGGHLGHMFPDGPPPTGQRWCMNGVAMSFQPGPTRV